MHCNLSSYVMLGVLVCIAASASGGTPADKPVKKQDDSPSLSQADSPEELARRIAELFPTASAGKLDRLVCAPDCTTAVAAAWERVRRTFPDADPHEIVVPGRQALSRFLGVLEARMRVPIPEAWEATFKSARAYHHEVPWFVYPEKPADRFRGLVKPKREGDQWVVTLGRVTVRVPAEDGREFVEHATVLVDGTTVYVALYGWPPTPSRLLAVDQGSGKTLWSTKVWAAGGLIGYEGQGWHFAEMSLADDRIAVFGVSDGAAYVEVFDKKTGANRCRFSTMYFMNAAHHPAGAGQKQVRYEAVTMKQNQPQSVFRGHINAAQYKKWFKSDYGVGGERVEIPKGATLFGALVLTDGAEITVVPFYHWGKDGDTREFRCQGFQLGRAPMFSASGATERAFFEDMKKRLETLD
jgi:hypothetical protein